MAHIETTQEQKEAYKRSATTAWFFTVLAVPIFFGLGWIVNDYFSPSVTQYGVGGGPATDTDYMYYSYPTSSPSTELSPSSYISPTPDVLLESPIVTGATGETGLVP